MLEYQLCGKTQGPLTEEATVSSSPTYAGFLTTVNDVARSVNSLFMVVGFFLAPPIAFHHNAGCRHINEILFSTA